MFRRSRYFWLFWNLGITRIPMMARETIRKAMKIPVVIVSWLEDAWILQIAQIAVTGAAKIERIMKSQAICTCSTSFVVLVIKEAVEKWLSSDKEKEEIFSLRSWRRETAKLAAIPLAKAAITTWQPTYPTIVRSM
jgi:hypothetical protein